jgi:hypothetical protein
MGARMVERMAFQKVAWTELWKGENWAALSANWTVDWLVAQLAAKMELRSEVLLGRGWEPPWATQWVPRLDWRASEWALP